MIIIETRGQDTNYIVGIFEDNSKALEYLQKLDNDKFVMSAYDVKFPFVIIERLYNNSNVFDIYQKLIDVVLREDEITHYSVREEFQPQEFGKDEMGRISHIHIVD